MPGAAVAAIALALSVIAGACSSGPAATFNRTGPCTIDGHAPGVYPDLELLIPRSFGGQPPRSLDSGRNCSTANLGSLASHGVTEVRFAGGVWPEGNRGITLAVFEAPGLSADWIGEWYEASARGARQTGSIKISKPVVAGRPANRLDLVNGESTQTVITWQSAASDSASEWGALVNVVIASDEPEDAIQQALAAFS